MSVRAGRLRHSFELKRPLNLRNSFGSDTGEFESIGNFRCEAKYLEDLETGDGVRQGQRRVEFTTRYNKSLSEPDNSMFITFKTLDYDIVSVLNPRFLNEYLVITAIERG